MANRQKTKVLGLVKQAAANVITVTSWTAENERHFNQSQQDALYEQAFLLVKAIGLLQ